MRFANTVGVLPAMIVLQGHCLWSAGALIALKVCRSPMKRQKFTRASKADLTPMTYLHPQLHDTLALDTLWSGELLGCQAWICLGHADTDSR